MKSKTIWTWDSLSGLGGQNSSRKSLWDTLEYFISGMQYKLCYFSGLIVLFTYFILVSLVHP